MENTENSVEATVEVETSTIVEGLTVTMPQAGKIWGIIRKVGELVEHPQAGELVTEVVAGWSGGAWAKKATADAVAKAESNVFRRNSASLALHLRDEGFNPRDSAEGRNGDRFTAVAAQRSFTGAMRHLPAGLVESFTPLASQVVEKPQVRSQRFGPKATAPAAAAAAPATMLVRLTELKALKEAELISEEEHTALRRSILGL